MFRTQYFVPLHVFCCRIFWKTFAVYLLIQRKTIANPMKRHNCKKGIPNGMPFLLFTSLLQKNNKPEPIANRRQVRIIVLWWGWRGSNPRPLACEANALTS